MPPPRKPPRASSALGAQSLFCHGHAHDRVCPWWRPSCTRPGADQPRDRGLHRRHVSALVAQATVGAATGAVSQQTLLRDRHGAHHGGHVLLRGLALRLPAYLPLTIAFFWMSGFASATQDIAGDGVYLTSTTPKEQALYVGLQGAFWNLGRVLVSGALVSLTKVLFDWAAAGKPAPISGPTRPGSRPG